MEGHPRRPAEILRRCGSGLVYPSCCEKLWRQSFVSMPITADGKTAGAINIHSLQKHSFDDEELRLLALVSEPLKRPLSGQQAEAPPCAREVVRLKNRLQAENVYLQEEITVVHHGGEMIGPEQNPRRSCVMWNRWRRLMPPCSSRARLGPARSSSPALSTTAARMGAAAREGELRHSAGGTHRKRVVWA